MKTQPRWLRMLLLLVIVIGISFRFINLDRKVFWHDEVYTSIRAAGYTRHEIDSDLFQNVFLPASALQNYQQIKPGSTLADTVRSLASEDPQHPPLYFLMARLWMHLLGGSIAASRLLPALLSLLSLPLIYGLALELFANRFTALLAMALLSVSPFDILFAQTARQYELLSTAVIGSSWLLLRALRLPGWQPWGFYTLSVAVGLYIHPFFALTLIAQGVFLLWTGGNANPDRLTLSPRYWLKSAHLRNLLAFGLASAVALMLFSPWIAVIISNAQRAASTTDWTRVSPGWDFLARLWTLSLTSLFFDLDVGFENPINYLVRLPFLALIAVALAVTYRRTPRRTGAFVLATAIVPFLPLALADLIRGGRLSATSRYLVSCYPSIQLAVAYLFTVGLGKPLWRWGLGIVLAGSVVSCGVSAMAETWWDKDLSYFNAEVAAIINAEADKASPVVVSDRGTDFTNMGDLISLSYRLKDNVRLYTVSQPANLNPLASESDVLVFRASAELTKQITSQGWQLERVSVGGRLWRLRT